MKNIHTNRLILIFFLIALCSTAFVISPKENTTVSTSVKTMTPTPQYPLKKMSFLERIIAKRVAKELKKSGDQIDLDETAKKAKVFGIASLISLLSIFLGIGLIVAPILGISAISKANLVLNHPDATDVQKTLAKNGKIMGIISLIIGVGLLILLVIAIANFRIA